MLNWVFGKLSILSVFICPLFSLKAKNANAIIIKTFGACYRIDQKYPLTFIMDYNLVHRIIVRSVSSMRFVEQKLLIEENLYQSFPFAQIMKSDFSNKDVFFIVYDIFKIKRHLKISIYR